MLLGRFTHNLARLIFHFSPGWNLCFAWRPQKFFEQLACIFLCAWLAQTYFLVKTRNVWSPFCFSSKISLFNLLLFSFKTEQWAEYFLNNTLSQHNSVCIPVKPGSVLLVWVAGAEWSDPVTTAGVDLLMEIKEMLLCLSWTSVEFEL